MENNTAAAVRSVLSITRKVSRWWEKDIDPGGDVEASAFASLVEAVEALVSTLPAALLPPEEQPPSVDDLIELMGLSK
ncbi:hypothetical protein [Streptomyces sp. DT117]|uniref:hypothetical protein n=1 Tax=Streptomyces sp. DT117 TaxID=3393422 RepID=UPI003CF88428